MHGFPEIVSLLSYEILGKEVRLDGKCIYH